MPLLAVSLSNSSDLRETSVIGTYLVPEFETSDKIEEPTFSLTVGPIFADKKNGGSHGIGLISIVIPV